LIGLLAAELVQKHMPADNSEAVSAACLYLSTVGTKEAVE